MARLKTSKSNFPCEEVADWHFYDLALGGVPSSELKMLREVWLNCAGWLVEKYGAESVRRFRANKKWPLKI